MHTFEVEVSYSEDLSITKKFTVKAKNAKAAWREFTTSNPLLMPIGISLLS